MIGSSHHQLAPPPQGTPAITSIAGHHPGGGGLVSALGINGGLGGLTAGQLQSLAGLGFQSSATSGASAFHRGLTGPHANLMAHPLLGLSSNTGGSAAAILSAASANPGGSGGQAAAANNILLLPKLP